MSGSGNGRRRDWDWRVLVMTRGMIIGPQESSRIQNTSIMRVRARQVSMCRLSNHFGSPPRHEGQMALRRAAELGQIKVRRFSKVRPFPSLRISTFNVTTSILCQIYLLNGIAQNVIAVTILAHQVLYQRFPEWKDAS